MKQEIEKRKKLIEGLKYEIEDLKECTTKEGIEDITNYYEDEYSYIRIHYNYEDSSVEEMKENEIEEIERVIKDIEKELEYQIF